MPRNVAIALTVAVVVVLLVQLTALALGHIEVALACAGLYVVFWFGLRAWMGRR